jgi:hypothetical protein
MDWREGGKIIDGAATRFIIEGLVELGSVEKQLKFMQDATSL